MINDRLVAAAVPLDLRFRIGRKAVTELLVSMRSQTAVAIGPHYLKREWPGTKAGSRVYDALDGPNPWEIAKLIAIITTRINEC